VIDELAKRDSEWRKISLHISKDKYIADEITQRMYLKLYNVQKEINSWYVYRTLKSCHIDYIREQKNIIIIDEIKEVKNSINYDYEFDKLIESLDSEVKKLYWYDREIVMLNQKKSLRKIEKETSITTMSLFYTCKKVKEKLKKQLEPKYKQWLKEKSA
jgi:hypothetical protein